MTKITDELEFTITYTYDAENIRISAETDTYIEEYVTDTVSSSLSRVLTATRYEKNAENTEPDTTASLSATGTVTLYLYGTGLISETKGDIILYHHYNHLGSTTKLTDADGAVVETYTYGTYGELLSGDATLTRFLYNGEMGVSTDDNGLFYMRQRYYNPEIKRFVNQDILAGSLDNSQSLNRYCYVQGNPVSYVDPFGLSPLSTQEGRHTVLGLLGCIPVIGIIFNGIDAYYYFKEGNIGMGLWSIVAMVSDSAALVGKGAMGYAKICKAANQGAKAQKYARMAVTAQKVHHGAELASNGVNFLKNGSMAVENAGEIYTKLKSGEKVGFGDWMELGANVLGMGLSTVFGYQNAQGLKAARQTDITGVLKGAVAEGACFVAGTKIKTEDGSKSIEEIRVGDYVYAKNAETGESGFKKVVRLFVKETTELIHLQIGDTFIETTPTHPFWVDGYGFKPAGELVAGDYVENADGELLLVASAYKEVLDEPVTVYNFEVEDWHTYYVSDAEIFVHNMCAMVTSGNTITFYHGTSTEGAASIYTNGVDLVHATRNMDFGRGFYVTTDWEQAMTWAARHGSDGGAVVRFEIPEEVFNNMNNKVFNTANTDWESFVINSRRGMTSSYDTVSGPMLANPKNALKGKEVPIPKGQQTVFNSQSAIDILNKYMVRK